MARFSDSIPPGRRMVQFRGPGVIDDAGLLAFRPDIESLPLFIDRRMDLLAEVDHGLAIPLDDASDLRAPSLMRAKPAKGSAKRRMVKWLA
jgi:hypothetical protein